MVLTQLKLPPALRVALMPIRSLTRNKATLIKLMATPTSILRGSLPKEVEAEVVAEAEAEAEAVDEAAEVDEVGEAAALFKITTCNDSA